MLRCTGICRVVRGPGLSLSRQRTQHSRLVRAGADVALIFSPEVVKPVFAAFNTLLLPPWALMILAPNTAFTKSVIKSNVPLVIFCLLFAYMFVAATAQNAATGANLLSEVQFLFLEAVTDPDLMSQMSERPGYAAQDWAHLCTWDYFAGQWIYLQGLDKRVFTRHSVLLAFNAGPLGLLLHWVTEAVTLAVRGEGGGDLESKIQETRRIAAAAAAREQTADDRRND